MIPRATFDDLLLFTLGMLFAFSIFLTAELDGWKPILISMFTGSISLTTLVDRCWKHLDVEYASEDVE